MPVATQLFFYSNSVITYTLSIRYVAILMSQKGFLNFYT